MHLNTYVCLKKEEINYNFGNFLDFGVLNGSTVAIVRRENGDIEYFDARELNFYCFEGNFVDKDNMKKIEFKNG